MKMGLDKLQSIIDVLPRIIAEAFSEENEERFNQLKEQVLESAEDIEDFTVEMYQDIGKCVDLVLEILADPLEAAGIDLKKSRGVSMSLKDRVLEKIEQL